MANQIQYKCPACGGAMSFDSGTQKMVCEFCGTQMEVSEFNENLQEQVGVNLNQGNLNQGQAEWNGSGASWQAGETDGMHIYACDSCGGEIVAHDTTGANNCPFCGNRIVLKEQFSGDLRPDYVIPFKLDKEAAKMAYRKHLVGKSFLPRNFKDENHIDEIKGVYVPFWLFDAEVSAEILFEGRNSRTWERGNTEYTETEIYHIQRGGRIAFQHIPADGSTNMDDDLMESIEPYQFSDAVPFMPAYLAGYVADRYDQTAEENRMRIDQRIRSSTEESFKNTIQGFQVLNALQSQIQITGSRYWYALYPVWILNTTWQGNKYTFAMNGQTGKLVGDVPVNKVAMYIFMTMLGIGIFGVLFFLSWLFLR